MNSFFLGAYWPPRKESIDQCADRVLAFFTQLSHCDDSLERWYETARSRKQALQKRANLANRASVSDLLARGRSRTDIEKKIIEDLGFHVGLWNGANDGCDAGLGIRCGDFSKRGSNCVTLEFPDDLGALRKADRMKAVLSAVATAWEPDWAGVMSDYAMDIREFDAKLPFVDWMLYISRAWLPTIPRLAPPASAEPVGAGTLITVQDELPDPVNKEDLENIRRVETALRSAWQIPKSEQV
jgi:immunity protein 52 of polymorphic toxin system